MAFLYRLRLSGRLPLSLRLDKCSFVCYNLCMDSALCYQYRLFPTPEQEALFLLFADARRWVWNHGVERKRAASLSYFELAAELVELKRQPPTSWLKQVHSQVLQQALLDLERSCTAHSKGIAGPPNFKSKHTCLPT